ncbi:MAG: MBL fold metallo-hydrolase [bacterium]|nr:MBL fold metallo-hydrolase [bacterium]
MKLLHSKTAFLVGLIILVNIFVWYSVFASSLTDSKLYFLNIGQGDSQLVRLPGAYGRDIRLLIDSGPDNSVIRELEKSLPAGERYLDLLIMTHAEADHLNGFIEIFKRYSVGAFVYNGRGKDTPNWAALAKELTDKKVPVIILGEGDRIRYGSALLTFLSPGQEFIKSEALNDSGFVGLLQAGGAKTLFTDDIDSRVEDFIIKKYDLNIDILKVAHHGSKFSTSQEFLDETTPKLAIIQVGKNNKYGHPNADVVQRLKDSGARVYRNDQDGTVEVTLKEGSAAVTKD